MKFLESLVSDKTVGIPYSDGLLYLSNERTNKNEYENFPEDCILLTQSTRIYKNDHGIKNKILPIPLDDDTFEFGLKKILEKMVPNLYTPWEYRKPIAYWRGSGGSGKNMENHIRTKVIEQLFDHDGSDALYVRTRDTLEEYSSTKYWDKRYDGSYQPVPMSEYVQHKYIIIIDNFILTSSYQWIFGTGSVPIIVEDPLNNYWFKSFLIPYVNYVPVTHPSVGQMNLKEVIDFLRNNDDVAKNIAKNALELSYKIFSSEFQREYIKNNLGVLSEQGVQ